MDGCNDPVPAVALTESINEFCANADNMIKVGKFSCNLHSDYSQRVELTYNLLS